MLLVHLHRFRYFKVGHIFGVDCPRIWCQLSLNVTLDLGVVGSWKIKLSQFLFLRL